MEEERESRTVMAQGMPPKSTRRELTEFFEKAGKVKDIRLIMDRNARGNRHKGIGYIEFAERESVPKALSMSGQQLQKYTVIIQHTQAEKNRAAETGASTVGPRRLYVGGLHYQITEEDLKLVFEPFGDLEFVQLQVCAMSFRFGCH